MLYQAKIEAQFGAAVLHQDFGEGNADPALVGPALMAGATSFVYSTSICPPAGSYTIVRRINVNGCFNDEWIPLSKDHTTGMDFGNMMLINNTSTISSSSLSKLVYLDTIRQPLCPGTMYQFSMAVINVDREAPCSPIPTFPVLAMNIEDASGQVLFTDTTRNGVGYASNFMGYKFNEYALNFRMPAVAGVLITRIVLLRSSADCGEDFAIDDIKVAPTGPRVSIGFTNEPVTTIVKSLCFQDNKSVSMHGTMQGFYTNPALQWQQSIDNGKTWTDIPGAVNNTYTGTFSVPDTFLFRLSGGEALNIANPYCRVISNLIKVDVDGIPTNFNAFNNSPVCSGHNLQFTATGGFAAYNWTGPNGFSDNSPFAHIFYSTLSDSGKYFLEVVTLGGCKATTTTDVTVIGTDVQAGPDTAVCKGEFIQLQVNPGVSYLWSPSKGLSATNVRNPRAIADVNTTYTVKLTDNFGCSDTAEVTIRVINEVAVKADFLSTEFLCRSYDSASFADKSHGEIESWNWDFGNGQVSLLQDPPIQNYLIPDGRTNFIAKLTVSDTAGCISTAYQAIRVAENCYIAVPTAFTPDGDGLNDYLNPLNAYKATDLLFQVYGRTGQLVFATRDWTNGWDGKINGITQSAGVYIWMLNYTDARKKKIFLKGTSVLIRK